MVGKFIREISRQEISCKLARMILKYAESNDIPPEKLLRGTGANLPYLFDSTNWTGENVIIKLFSNLATFTGNPDAALAAGKDVPTMSQDELFELIFNISRSPTTFYRVLTKWFALHFKTLELRLVKEHERNLTFQLQSARGKTIPEPLARWFEGLLTGVTLAYGLPEAQVAFRPAPTETAKTYNIVVAWRRVRKGDEEADDGVDQQKADFIVRRIIKRLEKSESKKADLDRLSYLLRESEGRFRTFFDAVLESVLIVDEGGFVFEVNRKALEMLKCKREEIIGMPAAKLVEVSDEDMIVGLLNLARQGRPIPMIELEFLRRDGKIIHVQASATSVIWPESSAPFKILLMIKDMSSIREIEMEAKRMRDLNEIIVSGMLEGIFVEDDEGICQFANPRMEEVLGYDTGELKGAHWRRLVPDDYVSPIEDEMEKRKMGLKNSYEAMLKKKDGSLLPVKISALPLFKEGSYAGVLSVVIDLTGIKKISSED
ncbi:MAG: PAS domain-containing protein [Pseudomonadota bacterium]